MICESKSVAALPLSGRDVQYQAPKLPAYHSDSAIKIINNMANNSLKLEPLFSKLS